MDIKKLRLFLLVIVLPTLFFMLAMGLQKYQYTVAVPAAETDITATAVCSGNKDCKACKTCNYCKHGKEDKSFCGVCQ